MVKPNLDIKSQTNLDEENNSQIQENNSSNNIELNTGTDPPNRKVMSEGSNLEQKDSVGSKWMIRFFVNDRIIKDVTFDGYDKAGNGEWKVTNQYKREVDEDIANAKLVFEKIPSCDWNSVVKKNTNRNEILSMLQEIAENWNSERFEGLICIFSSHGAEGQIYCSDGQLISIAEICAKLNVIPDPKLLFIQACQKCKESYSKKNTNTSKNGDPLPVEEADHISQYLTPFDHNFLVYFATTSEDSLNTRCDDGSIMFIYLFREIFKAQQKSAESDSDLVKYVDIYDLMTQVNNDMKQYRSLGCKKRIPVFVSTLTKHVQLRFEEVNCEHKDKLLAKIQKMDQY